MSTLLNQQYNSGGTSTTGNTSETAIQATPVLFSGEQSGVYFGGSFNFTPGAGATSITVRVRTGTGVPGQAYSGGTVLYSAVHTVIAADAQNIPLDFMDISGTINSPAGQAYTLTVQQTGATANGTVNQIYTRQEQQ